MTKLAVPSLVMMSAETAAFETITFAAGSLGPVTLATQSIMVCHRSVVAAASQGASWTWPC